MTFFFPQQNIGTWITNLARLSRIVEQKTQETTARSARGHAESSPRKTSSDGEAVHRKTRRQYGSRRVSEPADSCWTFCYPRPSSGRAWVCPSRGFVKKCTRLMEKHVSASCRIETRCEVLKMELFFIVNCFNSISYCLYICCFRR